MAKVICICGKIASGKSYYAKKLKEKENAVILSTDEVTYDLIDNEQGEFYDQFAVRVNKYLNKKAVEIVKAGTTVILDWGFWIKGNRKKETDWLKEQGVDVEWHYVDISDEDWMKNIEERNKKVDAGEGGSDFYVNEGLFNKVKDRFEEPTEDEIDVWYKFKRD